jgi:hypothetical protein
MTQNGGADADESPDGKLLYYAIPGGGLWSMPVEGGQGTPVLEHVRAGLWSLAESGIYYLDVASHTPDGVTPIMFFRFATRKQVQVGAVRKPFLTSTPGLCVSRDGRRIAWVQIDRWQSELMLVDNFR